jgi:gamma-glutamylcyclotransferase (GGCT)/AIG2-like uncharacterized protein YtfP
VAPEAQGPQRVGGVSTVLFVYGTLGPEQEARSLIAPHVMRHRANAVPGVLYDTGRGYPGAVFGAGTDLVRGWCCELADPPLDDLDAFEGDEYERITVSCTDGTEALAYQWIGPLGGCVVVPGGRWVTPTAVPSPVDANASKEQP